MLIITIYVTIYENYVRSSGSSGSSLIAYNF